MKSIYKESCHLEWQERMQIKVGFINHLTM